MSDSKKSDHWDLLASTILGANSQNNDQSEATPEVEEPASEIVETVTEISHIEVSVTSPAEEPAAAPSSQPLTSWDALAMELGIEVKPEPPPPAPAPVYKPVPKAVEKKEDLVIKHPQEPKQSILAEFGAEIEPVDVFKQIDEELEDQGDKKSRHRRRRRRKGSKDKDSSVSLPQTPVTESNRAVTEEGDLLVAGEVADRTCTSSNEESEEGESDRKRSRHRRSRRGSRNRNKKDGVVAEDKKVASRTHEAPVAAAKASQPTGNDDEYADDDVEYNGQRGAKAGFRAIPTWDESVGVIIAKNMESRPRRQGNGPSRSRSHSDQNKKRRR